MDCARSECGLPVPGFSSHTQRGGVGATTLEYRTSGTAAVAWYARDGRYRLSFPWMDDEPAILCCAVPCCAAARPLRASVKVVSAPSAPPLSSGGEEQSEQQTCYG